MTNYCIIVPIYMYLTNGQIEAIYTIIIKGRWTDNTAIEI